eukprot:Pgem_evm1s15221
MKSSIASQLPTLFFIVAINISNVQAGTTINGESYDTLNVYFYKESQNCTGSSVHYSQNIYNPKTGYTCTGDSDYSVYLNYNSTSDVGSLSTYSNANCTGNATDYYSFSAQNLTNDDCQAAWVYDDENDTNYTFSFKAYVSSASAYVLSSSLGIMVMAVNTM